MTAQEELLQGLSVDLDRLTRTIARTASIDRDALGACVKCLKGLAASDARSPTVSKATMSRLLGTIALVQNEARGRTVESAREQLDSAASELFDAAIAWLDGRVE